jgi:hypothetical protein
MVVTKTCSDSVENCSCELEIGKEKLFNLKIKIKRNPIDTSIIVPVRGVA